MCGGQSGVRIHFWNCSEYIDCRRCQIELYPGCNLGLACHLYCGTSQFRQHHNETIFGTVDPTMEAINQTRFSQKVISCVLLFNNITHVICRRSVCSSLAALRRNQSLIRYRQLRQQHSAAAMQLLMPAPVPCSPPVPLLPNQECRLGTLLILKSRWSLSSSRCYFFQVSCPLNPRPSTTSESFITSTHITTAPVLREVLQCDELEKELRNWDCRFWRKYIEWEVVGCADKIGRAHV